jgi:hypothetical protein
LYLVHEKLDNRARSLIGACRPEPAVPVSVCLLGTGLKNANRLSLRGRSDHLVRPWRRRAVLKSAKDVWSIWPDYMSYVTAIAAGFSYRLTVVPLLFQSALCMIRGRLHKYWVDSGACPSGAAEARIDWTGWSDVTQFDLALQATGTNTSHYVHGLIGDAFGYWGASSRCVCKTKADAELMAELGIGRYRQISYRADSAPIAFGQLPPEGAILLVTNLLHPANVRYRRIAESAQRAMFEILAEANTGRFRVVWRPHPAERGNKQLFPKFERLARALGFEIVGDEPLIRQIESSAYIVTSFSSVITDVVGAGRLPYLFAAVPWEDTPAWRCIPARLKFSDSSQLKHMLEPEFYRALCRADNTSLTDLLCPGDGRMRDYPVGSGSTMRASLV